MYGKHKLENITPMSNVGDEQTFAFDDCVDYRDYGENFTVPVITRKLGHAKVLWFKEDYFIAQGIDIYQDNNYQALCRYFLREFAVQSNVEALDDPSINYKTLYADRYGGSQGAFHGGSGRCASNGFFNAKGIGRTPLASNKVDPLHSHGFLSISEAFREVICGEVAEQEIPVGIIPVIAIIDCGESYDFNGNIETKAIVIRPNFLRPAHMERSIFFGNAGNKDSDQYKDALRVKQVINTVTDAEKGDFPAFLRRLTLNSAEQIGSARAIRLWQGQYLTSNVTNRGELVDFGSFRAVSNWHRAHGEVGEAFGTEINQIVSAVQSLSFYCNKYNAEAINDTKVNALVDMAKRKLDHQFINTCFKACGFDPKRSPDFAEKLAQAIVNYFNAQQKKDVMVDDREDCALPWLYDYFLDGAVLNSVVQDSVHYYAVSLKSLIVEGVNTVDECGRSLLDFTKAMQWLRPRKQLYYRISYNKAKRFSKLLSKSSNSLKIAHSKKYIDCQITINRRVFLEIPSGYRVIAYAKQGANSVYYCENVESGDKTLLLTGYVQDDVFDLFSVKMGLSDISTDKLIKLNGKNYAYKIAVEEIDELKGYRVIICRQEITLPRMYRVLGGDNLCL